MLYIITGIVLVILLAAAWWWLRRQKDDDHRLVAIVGLQENVKFIDASMVIAAAKRAWKADLGSADEEGGEGPDGFVVGMEITHMVQYRGKMFMINNFPKPYVEDPEEAAETITDLRLRPIMAKHRYWFSCDAMGVDGTTTDDEIYELYQQLGKLFAELLDDDCLGIYFPDSNQLFPVNQETISSLRAGNVLAAFGDNAELPIIEVKSDNPAMKAAVAQARATWPQFVAAYEAGDGEGFAAKAPITRKGNTEFIWITVTAIENDKIYGKLANEPGNLPGLSLDSKVTVSVAELNDWCYKDKKDEMQGGFTVKVVMDEMKKAQKRKRA